MEQRISLKTTCIITCNPWEQILVPIKKIQTEVVEPEDIAKWQESQRRGFETPKTEKGSWLNNIRRGYENSEPYEVAYNQDVNIK